MSKSTEAVPELQKNIQMFVGMLKDGSIEVQQYMLQTFQSIGSSGIYNNNINNIKNTFNNKIKQEKQKNN